MEHQDNFLLALDIDGTVTEGTALTPKIAEYLNTLECKVIFLTGRTFSFAVKTISSLKRPYTLVVQNGAITLQMPERKVIARNLLSKDLALAIDPLFHRRGYGFLVESGAENEDICYYKKEDFTPEVQKYLAYRQTLCPEKWTPIPAFNTLPVETFAAGKYFAPQREAEEIKAEIDKLADLNVVVLRDPFRRGYFLGQVMNKNASKAHALRALNLNAKVIAAGDDYNDFGMLEMADVKIVMKKSPEKLLKIADYLSDPGDGLVSWIEEARKKL